MTSRRKSSLFSIFAAIVLCAAGCAQTSSAKHVQTDPWTTQCEQWTRVLAAPRVPTTMADVTALLGTPPKECKPVEPKPMLGVQLDTEMNIVAVGPGSPAEDFGLRSGERILQVNGKKIKKENALLEVVRAYKEGDAPIRIQTDKGSYSVFPKMPKEISRCSWEVKRVDPGKGKESFETTCRFFDGIQAQCTSRSGK